MSSIDRLERLEASLTKTVAGFLTGLRSTKKPTTGTDPMTDPNDLAYPKVVSSPARDRNHGPYTDTHSTGGLTKRELFAAMAMQSIVAKNPPCGGDHDVADCSRPAKYARAAVVIADALIAELNKRDDNGQALGEAYRQSKGVAMRFIGPALPIGTKLYAHAPPAVPVESPSNDALDADRFRWLRDHAINTEGRKGSPWCVYGLDLGDCTPTFGAELVAFVDDAMTNGIVCSPVPVESLGRDAPIKSPASVPDGCPQGEVSCDDCGGREFGVYNKSAGVLFCHGCGQFTTLKPTNQEGAAP